MSAKVHYYQATGRANAIRLALAAANIPFEDVYPNGGFPVSHWCTMTISVNVVGAHTLHTNPVHSLLTNSYVLLQTTYYSYYLAKRRSQG